MININISEFGGNTVSRAEKILSSFPGGIDKAVKSAMPRAVSYLRTQSYKRIRERYDISQSNLRANENIKIRYVMGGGVRAEIYFSGRKIPLFRFGGASPKAPQFLKDRRVPIMLRDGEWRMGHPGVAASGHQLASTAPFHFSNAFVATMASGHTGIFERNGDGIGEVMGDSVAQMVGHDEVAERLAEDAEKKFEERLDHEVSRIINGWGG